MEITKLLVNCFILTWYYSTVRNFHFIESLNFINIVLINNNNNTRENTVRQHDDKLEK